MSVGEGPSRQSRTDKEGPVRSGNGMERPWESDWKRMGAGWGWGRWVGNVGGEVVAGSGGKRGTEERTRSERSWCRELTISHAICWVGRKNERHAGLVKTEQWVPAEAATARVHEARRAEVRRERGELGSGSGWQCSGNANMTTEGHAHRGRADSRAWRAGENGAEGWMGGKCPPPGPREAIIIMRRPSDAMEPSMAKSVIPGATMTTGRNWAVMVAHVSWSCRWAAFNSRRAMEGSWGGNEADGVDEGALEGGKVWEEKASSTVSRVWEAV